MEVDSVTHAISLRGLRLIGALVTFCSSLPADPIRERFWYVSTTVSADILTGNLLAVSRTSFVYYYGEAASGWARVSLLGGGLNMVEEALDNCPWGTPKTGQ